MKSRVTRGSGIIFPRRSITPDLLPTVDTGLHTRNAIEGGANIETEYRTAVGERRGRVVVDDVSDIFACPRTVDDPVVSVERWLGAGWANWRVRRNGEGSSVRETDLKRDGKSHPANINRRAFGDSWPGFPLNLARYGSEFLTEGG